MYLLVSSPSPGSATLPPHSLGLRFFNHSSAALTSGGTCSTMGTRSIAVPAFLPSEMVTIFSES